MAGSARGGLALTVAAAAAFGTSGTFADALLTAGWSPAAAVAARVGVAALALTVPAVLTMRGRWGLLRVRAGGWGRILAYGLVAVAGCQFCYFNALRHLPVGIALLLEYLGAVLVVGWMWVRHGQRPRRLTVVGGVTAMGGLAMMLGVSGAGRISLAGVTWGLLTAVCLAVYFTLSSADSDLPPIVTAWGGMCTGAVALYLLGVTHVFSLRVRFTDVVLLSHRVSWVVPVLGVSLIAAAFAYVAGIAGAQRLGPRLASFASMSEVMFAVLFAWIFLGQLPEPLQFVGGGLIFLGVVLVRMDEPRTMNQADDGIAVPPPSEPATPQMRAGARR